VGATEERQGVTDKQIEKVAKQMHGVGWRAAMAFLKKHGRNLVMRPWDEYQPQVKEGWRAVARWHLKQTKGKR
jgi:hypothetical protein